MVLCYRLQSNRFGKADIVFQGAASVNCVIVLWALKKRLAFAYYFTD